MGDSISDKRTSISSNTNGKTGSQARKTAAETRSQMTVAGVARVVGTRSVHGVDYGLDERRTSTGVDHNDRGNQSVNTQNTSHNDRKHVSHDGIRSEHTHGAYTNTGLGGSVSRTKV